MSTIAVNTINETTSGNGVTIDGLSIKDGGAAGAWTYVSTTTASGSATVEITGFTAGSDYMIAWSAVSPASTTRCKWAFI